MTWKNVPGQAQDIGIGANGTVWVVGTNPIRGGYGLWYWDGGRFVADPANGGGVRIAVAPDGHPWVVNDAHEIYERVNGVWTQRPGAGTDIAVGADGVVWKIGTTPTQNGYEIAKWTGSSWQAVDGGGVRIAVDPQGLPWVVNDVHDIYRRVAAQAGTPEHWQLETGPTGNTTTRATDIGIGGTTGEGMIWIIGAVPSGYGYGIYSWTGTGWAADPEQGTGVAISAGPDREPWIVNNRTEIWEGIGVSSV